MQASLWRSKQRGCIPISSAHLEEGAELVEDAVAALHGPAADAILYTPLTALALAGSLEGAQHCQRCQMIALRPPEPLPGLCCCLLLLLRPDRCKQS